MQNKNSHRKRWLIVGGIVLLLIIFVLFVDVQAIFRLLRRTNWQLWLVGSVLLLIGYAFNLVRWRFLLAGKTSWLQLFYGDSITYMLKMITPVPIMVSRIVTTGWMTPITVPQATSGMVIDRLLELMMRLLAFILVLILLAAQLTDANTIVTVLINLGLFVLAIVGMGWVSKHPETVTDKVANWLGRLPGLNEAKIHKTAGNFLQGFAYAGSTRRLMVGLLLSIVMWTFFLIFQYLVLVALPPALFLKETLLIALVVLVVVPPSTPAMIGIYHAIVVAVLVGLRLTDINRAIAYAILLHLPQMVFWLLMGALAFNQSDVTVKQLRQVAKTGSEKESPNPATDKGL